MLYTPAMAMISIACVAPLTMNKDANQNGFGVWSQGRDGGEKSRKTKAPAGGSSGAQRNSE